LVGLTQDDQKQGRPPASQIAGPTPVLLWYSVAHQYAVRGQSAQADEAAQRARRLPSSTDEQTLLDRLPTAMVLMRRGDFAWAELELRLVGSSGNREAASQAMYLLAEMYHDQEKDHEAAKLLSGTLERLGAVRLGDDEDGDSPVNPRARMYYFYACHYARLGNAAKQRNSCRGDP
jgi:hypothetical protein